MAAQVATGKTVEEAIANALRRLGCERDEADIEILETASNGIFGLFGGHPAKVRVTKKAPKTEAAPAKKAATRPAQKPEIHKVPVDAVEKSAAKPAASIPPQKSKAPAASSNAPKTPAEPQELIEAKKMAAESDRPWQPPAESGAIDTPYSEQRSYGVTAATAPANVKPFGDNTRRAREERETEETRAPRDDRRRPRRERQEEDRRSEERPSERTDVRETAAAPRPAVPSVPVVPDYEGVAEAERTPRQRAEAFRYDVFRCMGLDVQMMLAETDEGAVYNLQGKGLGLLIGKHGQTLDALQYLANLAANKGQEGERCRVILDVEGYRSRREETLRRLASHLADKACRIHAEVRLEPMNRHERKIIHMALQENRRVSTYSDGEEPYRCVVIAPKKRRRFRPRRERNEETPVERIEEE